MKIRNKIERGLEVTVAREPDAKLVVLSIACPCHDPSTYSLTPSQARRIASALVAEADRIRKRKQLMTRPAAGGE